MKKHLCSAALALLLILLIPAMASADVIYPAPPAMTVGQPVDHLLATLDPGGTVSVSGVMPEGLYLDKQETDDGVNVYLRGVPIVAGTYDLIINYNGSNSICTLEILTAPVDVIVPVAISVATMPDRTQYTAGETLDSTGLSILVLMSDGSTETVTEGFVLSPTLLENAGTQQIEVSYGGLLCTFEVEVEPAPEVIEEIGVLNLPEKIVYEPGDTLDPTGLTIRVYTNNGTRDVGAEELSCSPMELETAGSQVITVEYEGHSCTFTVQVLEEEIPASLTIAALPTKLDYFVGDTLDTAGLVLLLTRDQDSVEYVTTNYSCKPFFLDQAGKIEIVVRYQDLECSFLVNVRSLPPPTATPPFAPEETDTPLPSPTAPQISPVPASPRPSAAPETMPAPASPQPTENGPRSQSGLLVGVIVAAAILALLVLGVYVFWMNRSGKEYFAESLRDLFRGKRK